MDQSSLSRPWHLAMERSQRSCPQPLESGCPSWLLRESVQRSLESVESQSHQLSSGTKAALVVPRRQGWAGPYLARYGAGFWLQGRYAVPKLGPIIPVWISYGIAVFAIPALSSPLHVSLAFPPGRALLPVFACGAFSAAGYLALNEGLARGYLAVVPVASSSSSAITVVLGRVFDGTRVAAHQWVAIAVIVIGVALLRG